MNVFTNSLTFFLLIEQWEKEFDNAGNGDGEGYFY